MKAKQIKNIVGTGGIGTGQFFLFHTEKELGRNESRMARLSDAKDYCKLHIVFHYLGKLLSPEIEVIPIGKVGCDAYGHALKNMMIQAGLNVRWVQESPVRPTMYSVCFQYPDKSGGNITTDNSACMEVEPSYVLEALSKIDVGVHTIAVALPEVPLESRLELLRYAKARGAFCVASCGAEEVREFIQMGGPDVCDLIALNQDETAVFADFQGVSGEAEAKGAARVILKRYPHLILWLTYGCAGSLLVDTEHMISFAALKDIRVINTGGAGDASLSGLICGHCLGLPFFKEADDDWGGAGSLAVLMAGLSVESADSINEEIEWDSLRARKNQNG